MAALAGLADIADGRLDGLLVAALDGLAELADFLLNLVGQFVELRRFAPDLHVGLGRRTLFGAGAKGLPVQADQGFDDVGVLGDDLLVVGDLVLGHADQRPEAAADDIHDRLAKADLVLGFDLRQGGGGEAEGNDGDGDEFGCHVRSFF